MSLTASTARTPCISSAGGLVDSRVQPPIKDLLLGALRQFDFVSSLAQVIYAISRHE